MQKLTTLVNFLEKGQRLSVKINCVPINFVISYLLTINLVLLLLPFTK